MAGCAWVTLATNDSYSLGALVLAHSLRRTNTAHQLAVLITPAVSPPMREQLNAVFDVVRVVDVLDSKDEANLALLKRPELGVTFTKLHCWTLTQFTKAVFLDADTLVVRNSDDLFERDEFSAAPDVGWPDCFNSGVFVFRPSIETFNNLVKFAVEKGSFDGGDQGLLNSFFNTWATDDIRKHLPFVYNLTSVAVYSYIPAFKQYGSDTRIVHFIGPVKPWLQPVDPGSRTVQPAADSAHLQPLLQHWWDIFIEKVHPTLSSNLDSASGMLQAICAQLEGTSPLEPSLPPPAPTYPEPYTPYIEKDDARQYNLPYQPFQVVSNEGELLNFTFAEFARELDNPEPPQPEETVEEAEEPPPPPPPPVEEVQPEHDFVEEVKEPEPYHEPPPVPENPFDYHRFVPDESVISAYMEHNIQQYQPYEVQAPQPPEEPPLPRFLTIPEDDPRQGHVPYQREPSPERQPEQQWQSWHMPDEQNHQETWSQQESWQHNQSEPVPQREPSPVREVPSMSRSKSMSNLMIDATDASTFQGLSHWKSQPEIAPVETKKLPGLKPLKPKDKTPTKVAPKPKYTEFTEFFMVNQFRDPFAPPADKVGFVERAILKRAQSQRGLFDVPQGALEPPKPAAPEKPTPKFQIPAEMNEYVDLLNCKRQEGNVPKKQGVADKENLKPEKLGKRSPHRRTKRSTKKMVEKEKTPEPCNVSHDVDAILQRLSTLSTGYAPIEPPAPKEPIVTNTAFQREKTPQPSDHHGNQLFRDSPPKSFSSPKKVADYGVVGTAQQSDSVKRKSAKKVSKKNDFSKKFGPWNGEPMEEKKSLLAVSPFAAQAGHSLSESEGLVPEIVVCAATPMEENPPQLDPLANRLDVTFVVDKCQKKDDLDIPEVKSAEEKAVNGVNGTYDPVDDIEVQIKKMSFVDLELKVDYNPLISSEDSSKEVPPVSNVNVGIAFNGSGAQQVVKVREVLPSPEEQNGTSGECEEATEKRDEYEVDLMFAKVTLQVEVDEPEVETQVQEELEVAEANEVTGENGSERMQEAEFVSEETSAAAYVVECAPEVSAGGESVNYQAEESKVSEPETSEESLPVTADLRKVDVEVGEKETSLAGEVVRAVNELEVPTVAENEVLVKPQLEESRAFEPSEESSSVAAGTESQKDLQPTEYSSLVTLVTDTQKGPGTQEDLNRTDNWTVTASDERISAIDEMKVQEVYVGATKKMVDEKQCSNVLCHANVLCKNVYPNVPETLPECDISAAVGISMTVDNVQNKVKVGLKMDFSDKNPKSDELPDLDTNSPKEVSEGSFQNGTTKTPLPIIPQYSTGLTYADAAKREGVSSVTPKEPTTVFYLPEAPQPAPVAVKSKKRPRREIEIKNLIEKSSVDQPPVETPTPPVTHKKRKSEKPEFELPANRFELLPEEKMSGVAKQKKQKKVSKFAAPPGATYSLSLPSSYPPDSIVRATPEDALYLPEPDDNPGIAGAIAQLSLEPGTETAGSTAAQTEYLRRQSWETGKMDYMGRDSFANIWSKISETLSQQQIPEPSRISPQRTPSPLTAAPVSLSMILDDSIDTLPSDAATSPGEPADDDVIFDRRRSLEVRAEPPTLPGIAEEAEEVDDPPPLGDLPLCGHVAPCVANIHGVVTAYSLDSQASSIADTPDTLQISSSDLTPEVKTNSSTQDTSNTQSTGHVGYTAGSARAAYTSPISSSATKSGGACSDLIPDTPNTPNSGPASPLDDSATASDSSPVSGGPSEDSDLTPGEDDKNTTPVLENSVATQVTADLTPVPATPLTRVVLPVTPVEITPLTETKDVAMGSIGGMQNSSPLAELADSSGETSLISSFQIYTENSIPQTDGKRLLTDFSLFSSSVSTLEPVADTSLVKDLEGEEQVTTGDATFETIFVKTVDESGPILDGESAESDLCGLETPESISLKKSMADETADQKFAGKEGKNDGPEELPPIESNPLLVSEEPAKKPVDLSQGDKSLLVDEGTSETKASKSDLVDEPSSGTDEKSSDDQDVSQPAIHSDTSAFAVYKPVVKPEEIAENPRTVRRQTSNDDAKEKKGVFTKILEFVGVKKKEEEVPVASSIFYDDAVEKAVDAGEDLQKTGDELSVSVGEDAKKRSPSPRINIPNVPSTHVIEATPPAGPGVKPPRRDSDSLTVDTFIPDTPPVVEKKTPIIIEPKLREQLDRDVIMEEIDEIIAKAKLIAQDQIEDDPIYSNLLASPATTVEPSQPPTALCEDFEEIKVTPQQERGRPKETTSSKLAGQILKAIPPPRRRPISSSRRSDGPSVEVQLDKNLDVVHETPPPACLERTQSVASSHVSTSPSVSPQLAAEISATPPPVPPRRRRSKQRTDPEPPPKRKAKK